MIDKSSVLFYQTHMIIAALFLLSAALLGISILAVSQTLQEKVVMIMVGSISGLALVTTLVYVATLVIPLTPLFVLITILLTLLVSAFLIYKGGWKHFAAASFDKTGLIIFGILLLLFSVIAPKLLLTQEDGLHTGIINAYGDIAWHMANITMFAEGQTLPPENPIFAGTRLTYPFMTNFLSAILLVAGASIPASVNVPAVILIPVLLTLVYCLTREYSGSKNAATIAMLLILFGGATLGWTRFGSDFQASNVSLFEFLLELPNRDYSGVGTDEDGYHFLNPITTLLLPQRSFLFGIPLALSILILLKPTKKIDETRYILAGVLAGLLPLFHAHTVLVMIPTIIGLFILSPGTHWILFILPALIVGLPEVLYYARGQQESGSFFRFEPGWMSGDIPFVWYWIKNTGLLIPLALAGLFIKDAPKTLKVLTISGLIMLIAGNTFLFAPWAWDNFKILVFWLIFSVPMLGWLAMYIIKRKPFKYVTALVVVILAVHMLSAALDIWKLALPTASAYGEWDNGAIAAGEMIRQNTNPGDTILTAPYHNSPVVLAGRARYLGFAAHVWSHGGLPWDRENAIKPYYQGTLEELPDFTPDYVVVGPIEEREYAPIVTRPTWQFIAQAGGYTLYRIQ